MNTDQTEKECSTPSADTAAKLIEESGFPATGAATMVTILRSGLKTLDNATHTLARQIAGQVSPAPIWLSTPLELISPERSPLGFGWMADGRSGSYSERAYWFDRTATVILPAGLRKGTKLIITGRDRGNYTAPRTLSCFVGDQKLTGRSSWIMPGNWKYLATIRSDIHVEKGGIILSLASRARGAADILLPTGEVKQQSASLSIAQIRLVPPSDH